MMRNTQSRWWAAAVLALALGLLATPATAGPSALAAASVSPSGIQWQINVNYEKLTLTVSGPGGLILRRDLAAAAFDAVGDDGKPLPDGAYTYELVAAPQLDRATRRALAAARRSGDDSAVAKLQAEGKLPQTPMVLSGTFRIAGGALVQNDAKEPQRSGNGAAQKKAAPTPVTAADQVIPDDLIVQGSECVGLDCVNNESFGFDTIRLKENNTRIKFDDTSTSTGFPANDWQLTANDSASGGSSKFSIEDITGSKVPFTVTAGAATNSIFVDSTGRVGLRTSTPVLDLHIATSNTPAMRLEQNNSGGFTAQTWDIAGNEANFFVRDVTGGSRLPFRIRPGAPTSSIDINASGNVGIGTASPSNKLHVSSSDSAFDGGKVLFQNTSGTTTAREGLEINNNGQALFILKDTSQTPRWAIGTQTTNWVVDNQANGTTAEMTLSSTGNLTITGTYTPSSSRTVKEGFSAIEPRAVLRKVLDLPITTWSYKRDPGVRHIGPVSEDFFAAFAVGTDDKGISVTDSAGVTLAAIQGLNQVVQEKDKEITDLKSRVEALEKLVQSLAREKAAAEPQH